MKSGVDFTFGHTVPYSMKHPSYLYRTLAFTGGSGEDRKTDWWWFLFLNVVFLAQLFTRPRGLAVKAKSVY